MFKKDNKVICIEDNAWVKKGCKGIVIQEGDSKDSPCVLWESDGVGSKNIKLYVKAKYLQLLEEPKSESLKPEDLIPGEWYKIVSTGRTKNWIFKFHSLVNSNIKTILSTAIGSGSYNGLGTWGNIIDIVNIEKATKEEVLKYYPDEFKSKEPEENLVGRYIKALVDNPVGIGMNIGEYLLITAFNTYSDNTYDVTRVKDNQAGFSIEVCHLFKFELMPIGFNPEVEDKFIVGAWYKIKNCKTSYRKCLEIPTEDCLPYVESIENGKYLNDSISKCYALHRLQKVDISEIQQYLPEGHVDKINTNPFKERDYVEIVSNSTCGHNVGTIGIVKTISGKYLSVYSDYGDSKTANLSHVFTDLKLSTEEAYLAQGKSNSEEFKVGDWLWWISEGVAFKVGIDKKVHSNDKMNYVVITTNVDYYNNHKTLYRRATPEEIAKAQGYITEDKPTSKVYNQLFTPLDPAQPSPDCSIEAILEYCKIKYPVGCTYKSVKTHSYDSLAGNQYTISDKSKIYIYNYDEQRISDSEGGYLYCKNGGYAEIIFSSKQEFVKKYPLVPEECFTFVKPKKKEYPFDEQAYLSKPFNQKLELNLKVKTNKKSKITI